MSDYIRAIAQRIANEHLEDAEYSIVYDDETLEDLSEDEWQQVHNLIMRSKAVLPDEHPADR